MPTHVNIKTKFIIQGKEYASPDEMPAEIRSAYEQALAKGANSTTTNTTKTYKVTINGKTYDNADEIPEDLRAVYTKAMDALDQNQDGTRDSLQQNAPDAQGTFEASAPLLPQQANVISSSKTDKRMMSVILAVVLVVVLLAVFLLVLLSRG